MAADRHRGDGKHPEHRPDERLSPRDAVHLGAADRGLAGARGLSRRTSGFFSKDEILAFADDRGGIYWICAIRGYLGALLTAYSFRIVFRVVPASRARGAGAGESGHVAHASREPRHRRERGHGRRLPRRPSTTSPSAAPMPAAMAVLGSLALFGAWCRSRGRPRRHALPRADLREVAALHNPGPQVGTDWAGLAIGGADRWSGSPAPTSCTCCAPQTASR